MPQKGLGTGLGALFGDAALNSGASDFEYMPLARIEPKPDQPRSVFEQERIDELTDSIKEHGVLSPLTVRDVGGGYYQIIAGERRWRAARAAGLDEVPVRIVVADDRKAMELAMVENLQREDLSPVEEARGYRALIEDFGLTQEEVAQRVSKSRPAVANMLRLLSLPDPVLQLVGNGALPAGSARALLGLKNKNRIQLAGEKAVRERMNVRDVERLVRKLNAEDSARKRDSGSSDRVDYATEAQNALSAAMGRRVTITLGRNKGKIELEFYSQDDFDFLFDLLSKSTEGLL